MNDCDALFRQVQQQAAALGIPYSPHISPKIVINTRSVNRLGCCKFKGEEIVVEVALRVAQGPEASCRETLAHELLHTCPGCRDHGRLWKSYARRMNEAYGYQIARTSDPERLGVERPQRPYRYRFRCQSCGAELGRYRSSPFTQHPERYRCRCGGKFKQISGE